MSASSDASFSNDSARSDPAPSTMQPPPVVLPELDCSLPSELLRETAYHEQLGIDRALYPVYRAVEAVHRRLEQGVGSVERAEQLRGAGAELVALENAHKKEGVWCGDLRAGVVPRGQAALNDLLERTHALEAELIRRIPDHRDVPPQAARSG